MALTPFHDVPKLRFLARIGLPLFLSYWVGFLIMGMVVENPKSLSIFQAGAAHHRKVQATLFNLPQACKSGSFTSDFQRKQCDDFWLKFTQDGIIAAIPFAFVFALYWLAQDSLALTYRRGLKRIQEGKALFSGKVTDPAALPQDAYGWFYCFRSISVQLSDGRQLRVYTPVEAPIPRPGEILAVFDGGNMYGKSRALGVIYTPHVMVVRGGK